MKKNILVFPCGSEIGLEINNALRFSAHVNLFGGSSVESNHGHLVYKNYIDNIPYIDDPNFLKELNKIIKKYKIDFIFPAHDSVVTKLSQNLDNLGCSVIGSNEETCTTCRSKEKTYEVLRGVIKTPTRYNKNDKIVFPVFLKPKIGQGSKGVYLAKSKEEIDFYLKSDPELLILENLPGKEYTIDCFTDKNGKLRFIGARERIRISNGISVDTKPITLDKLDLMAEEINKKLKLRGAWFFQAKEDKNKKLTLLEVAPRIAGTMALYRNLGINFALLSIFDALDIDVAMCLNSGYQIRLDRALVNRFQTNLTYKHVYIDLDDTIIFNGKINEQVFMFIAQCINKNIQLHLITRHKTRFGEKSEEYLKKFRMNNLFDFIIEVPEDKEKAEYIKYKQAIFIDDSFTEREKVARDRSVPTFEVSSIESLIDWRK